MNPIADFLSGIHGFDAMSRLEIEALSAFLGERSMKAGDVVFSEGETGTEFYIVRSGLIGSRATQGDGGIVDIYEFGPGRFFGEMAIIEGLPRSASCYAKTDAELLVIEGIDFYRLVWDHPIIGVKLLTSMREVMQGWLAEASGFLADLVRWGESARRRAIVDEASGLFNRRYLDEALELADRRGSPYSLLMLDIDHFHEVNTAYGLPAGDATIANVGSVLQRLVRESDVAARLSGDEFALLLSGAGKDKALFVAERVRTEIESLFLEFKAGKDATPARVSLTASLGVASFPLDASDRGTLVQAADKALGMAKEAGRNRVVGA